MVVVCVVAFSIFNNEEKETNDYVPPVVGESHSESGLNFYIYPSEDYVDQLHNEGYTDEEIEKFGTVRNQIIRVKKNYLILKSRFTTKKDSESCPFLLIDFCRIMGYDETKQFYQNLF